MISPLPVSFTIGVFMGMYMALTNRANDVRALQLWGTVIEVVVLVVVVILATVLEKVFKRQVREEREARKVLTAEAGL